MKAITFVVSVKYQGLPVSLSVFNTKLITSLPSHFPLWLIVLICFPPLKQRPLAEQKDLKARWNELGAEEPGEWNPLCHCGSFMAERLKMLCQIFGRFDPKILI